MAFIGVDYFDQTLVEWYIFLAMLVAAIRPATQAATKLMPSSESASEQKSPWIPANAAWGNTAQSGPYKSPWLL